MTNSGTYACIVVTHALVCSLATRVLARLQTIYVVLNVLYVRPCSSVVPTRSYRACIKPLYGRHYRLTCSNSERAHERR